MAEIIIFIFSGVFIGIAAGLFGLGGGLMIVPVVTYCLVYFSNTPFDQAIIIGVSTSLASMATLFVPFLVKNNIPPKLAIGTSSVLGFFIGLSASIAIYVGYLYSGLNNQQTFGFIYTPAILFLTLPSLIFIKLSAGWLLKLDDLLIKRLFSLLLVLIGIMMLLN